MTDFFAQLGARHRGEAGVLQPRVPFRFEPVSASLAAADLTGGSAAEPGWRAPHPDWPFRRPTGPARPDEPWTGSAAGNGGELAGLEPASAMAGRPRPAGLRPVHPAWPLGDQAADMDLSGRDPLAVPRRAAPGGQARIRAARCRHGRSGGRWRWTRRRWTRRRWTRRRWTRRRWTRRRWTGRRP
jgi:hypothetical protein